jgi:hypothetical protein
VLKGEPPKDNRERLALAQRAHETSRHATAAKLWAEALDVDPNLTDDRQAQHRYNAACAAAPAAAAEGKDDRAPDDAVKLKLRQRALAWLQAELTVWKKLLETAKPEQRAPITRTLKHWQQDSDLAGLRDAGHLAKLPGAEQTAWQALWADVAVLIERAAKDRPDVAPQDRTEKDAPEVPQVETGLTDLPQDVFDRP